jgi:hypothetical protein
MESPGHRITEYRPIVEFRDERGERVTGSPSAWKPYPDLVPGRRVTISYDRDAPSTLEIEGYSVWRPKLLAATLGGMLVVSVATTMGAFPSSDTLRWFASVFTPSGLFAIGLLVMGAFSVVGTIQTKRGPSHRGTVVGDYICSSPQAATLHHAMVRWFSPEAGTELEVATGRGRIEKRYEVGSEVTVYQHPADPSRILIATDGPNAWGLGCLLAGALLAAVLCL